MLQAYVEPRSSGSGRAVIVQGRRYFPVRTGAAGRAGSGAPRVSSGFITSATARSSCGSLPAITDFGSFSTSMSGSTP